MIGVSMRVTPIGMALTMAKARVLTRLELAEHLGVDKQMVTKWERSGMPVHTRGRGVASQFRLGEVRAWLRVREAKAKAAEKAKGTFE